MKALIVIDKLWTGGVTTSLINYLKYAADKIEIDLLVFGLTDESRKIIPENVHILDSSKFLSILGFNQSQIKHRSVWLYLFRAFLTILSRYINGTIARKILFVFCPSYGDYDVAISYTHDVTWKSLTTGCNDFVLNKVRAKYKASYVHCDFKNYGGYHPNVEKIYSRFDKVVCVSEGCRNSFVGCFPNLDNITTICENFADIENILASSSNYVGYDNSYFNIVTVCRIDKEKGVFRALDAIVRLIEDGHNNIRWRIVGNGPDLQNLESRIVDSHINRNVELVGLQQNPYRFIKGADLFLLPSLHEAAPMVFGESQVLRVPILTTETTSAKELVENRGIGFVCANTTEGIYDSLKQILEGKKTLPTISQDLAMSVNDSAINRMQLFYTEAKKQIG